MSAADASLSRIARVLAAHARVDAAAPGDTLSVSFDRVLVDGEGGLAVADAWNRTGRRKRAARGERLLLVDGGRLGRRDRPALTAFAREQGATLDLDPGCAGWPSQVAVEEGLVGAEQVIAALDPEVGALGGLGTVVVRVTPDQAADLLQHQVLELRCPNTLVVAIDGRLPRWVGPFDVAVAVIESVGGHAAARGRVLELRGSAMAALGVDDRMTLCGTFSRAGLAAIVPPDVSTRVWLAARRRDGGPEVEPDDAEDLDLGLDPTPSPSAAGDPASGEPLRLDARRIALAALDDPWPGKPLELGSPDSPVVTQVILGGRLADLRQAAHALAERPLARGLQLSVLPASRRVLVQALEEGLVTQFVRAGAAVWPPGAPPPTAPRRERRVTTVPTGGTDLLCGAAVAGASALAGRLVDPETVRREVRRGAAIR